MRIDRTWGPALVPVAGRAGHRRPVIINAIIINLHLSIILRIMLLSNHVIISYSMLLIGCFFYASFGHVSLMSPTTFLLRFRRAGVCPTEAQTLIYHVYNHSCYIMYCIISYYNIISHDIR